MSVSLPNMYLHPPAAAVNPPPLWDSTEMAPPSVALPQGKTLGGKVGSGAGSEGEEPWGLGLPALNTVSGNMSDRSDAGQGRAQCPP